MASSFTNKKELMFVVTLGTGTFGSSTNNQITLQGFRASANVDKSGGQQMGTLRAQIYGVSQSDMNSITTTLWQPGQQIKNQIQVYAIDGPQLGVILQNYDSSATWFAILSSPKINSAIGEINLTSGTATVTTTAACAPSPSNGCNIQLTRCNNTTSTAVGVPTVTAAINGTSFTITSLSATNTTVAGDVGTVCWVINP